LIDRSTAATLRSLTSALTFSVAMPVRDHVDFLDTALRSLEAQQAALQVAVLDASDGDRVQDVVRGRRVAVAYGYHRADAGQAAAIQEGWNNTHGQIVAWLNADDYYFPGALDRVAAVFDAQPDVDVVFGHAVHVSAEGDFLSYFPAIDPDPQTLTDSCSIAQPSCFVRRSAMERVGGLNVALHFTMDWDLWLRLYTGGCRFAFLDEPLSAVRLHPATKTTSRARTRYREIDELLASAGAPYLRRARTLLSFYRYDLENRRVGWTDRSAFGLMSFAARWRRTSHAPPPRVVRGIECWTNLVRGACRIDLPWYGRGRETATVTVMSDRPIELVLKADDGARPFDAGGAIAVVFHGEETAGYRYSAPVPTHDGRLSVDLSSGNSPWRLLRVQAA
jgi:glycosyltransferase involved in cell wall biosynthesis